jgi:superfamily II DNA or RNA helicase
MLERKGQQIMILAHNRNLLTYLHDAIEHRKLATAGYYVGGMKELDLKKSETCQVIIATYAMAAEALDIKTLTTLILATPKTDVIQAVGRILRVKHERPLVVDIIDSHEVFLSQWQKRRKYYASNNYKIMHTKSHLYASGKWTELSDSKSTVCKSAAGKSTACKSTSVAGTSVAGTGTAGKSKKKGGEEVEPTNLLGKGVAAAAKYINSLNAVSINAAYDEDEADETDYIVGKLSGKCFITTR